MQKAKSPPIPLSRYPMRAVVVPMLLVGASVAVAAPAHAQVVAEVQFNEGFLQRAPGEGIDISRFSKGNIAAPGQYRADLFVNQVWQGAIDVTLRALGDDKADVQPCFDRPSLERLGVDVMKIPEQAATSLAGSLCVPLPVLIADATAIYDSSELRLDVSIPQAFMARNARGYVDPKFWDDGINAAKLQYNASTYRSESYGTSYSQSYVGLNAGFNVGPWRFNHTGSYSHSDLSGSQYQAMQTNVRRSIAAVKSQLTVGDGYTDGALFESVGFRGLQMASDDRMYPESQRGYAPLVRGIASSAARVQVRQNGNIIYETTVQPGAFEINDLYATGYGGDLEVIVTEANGSVHITKVPYAAAVNALRPGVTRYSVTGGRYRNINTAYKPFMLQSTVQHGISNLVTGYGGATFAENYGSIMMGAALNTDYGAFGADVTYARTKLRNEPDRSGQSYRLSYSKLIDATNTNLTLAAYRYSTRGYLGLADAMALSDLDHRNLAQDMLGIQRGRLQLTLNQNLAQGWGNFYLTGSTQDYWNRSGRDTQFTFGYNNFYGRMSYGIAASREFNLTQREWGNRVILTFGIPLGKSAGAPMSMTSLEHESRGLTSVRESVSGSVGDNNQFSYGLNAARSSGGASRVSTSVGASGAYVTPMTTLSASVSKGSNYNQYSAGMSGGMVAYAGGVAFTPTAGETMAIIEAKDAAGARVINAAGLKLDPWGRAIAANMIPFSRNQVEIDPKGLPLNVELKSTTESTNPTAGAVTLVKFDTQKVGMPVLIRARQANGKPLPFGATVLDSAGMEIGVVGQGSKILARISKNADDLTVRWGDTQAGQCRLTYAVPAAEFDSGDARSYRQVEAVCVS